jgi:hypothetical protein
VIADILLVVARRWLPCVNPFSDERQTLHDRMSGTVVLRRPQKT